MFYIGGDAAMTNWMRDELDKIGKADELEIITLRRDGTERKPVTIWVVRHGDDLYVRSADGRGSTWFRGTQDSGDGHIHAGGVDKDVTFVEAGGEVDDEIDEAYRTKYHRYDARYVDPIVSPEARAATLRLLPRSSS
jgi:hypothetical protein